MDVSYLVNGEDDEGASASDLGDDGKEFRVDGAELRIVGVLRYLYVIVAFLPFRRFAVDVPKLRTPDAPEPKLKTIAR